METFRTPLILSPSKGRMSLSDSILTIGSCFSDTIGAQLIANKFKVKINPFGTIYNPHSIHKVVRYAISNQPAPRDTYVQREDTFLNYDFNAAYAALDLDSLKGQTTSAITDTHTCLKNAKWLILTYGTAWVFERAETHEVVANCHKMPQSMFTKSLLTQKKVLDTFDVMYHELKAINPSIEIILTVSPVRHLKETLELNSVSKSILRVACHTMTEQHTDVHYFPAYEIVMDDLRDYRFYKADMIHPSSVAEEYIWEKFSDQYFDESVKIFLSRWKEIRAALNHKPFQPESKTHQQFLRQTIKRLEELKDVVNVDKEVATLRGMLQP